MTEANFSMFAITSSLFDVCSESASDVHEVLKSSSEGGLLFANPSTKDISCEIKRFSGALLLCKKIILILQVLFFMNRHLYYLVSYRLPGILSRLSKPGTWPGTRTIVLLILVVVASLVPSHRGL